MANERRRRRRWSPTTARSIPSFGNAQPERPDAVPLRQRDRPAAGPGDLSDAISTRGEIDAPGFAPFQHEDAAHDVAYEPGVATFRKTRGDLVERILSVRAARLSRRHAAVDAAQRRREDSAPARDAVLRHRARGGARTEHRQDLARREIVDDVLLFENPKNDFMRGIAFVATSLLDPVNETIRTRFFGAPGRNIRTPVFVETGASDARSATTAAGSPPSPATSRSRRAARRRSPSSSARRRPRSGAERRARGAKSPTSSAHLAATRSHWAKRLGRVEVTHQPAGFRPARQHLAALPDYGLAPVRAASAPTSAAAPSATAISCRTCCR